MLNQKEIKAKKQQVGEGEKKNEEVYGKEAAAFTDRTR